jgi:hypothetical protein
LFLNLTEDDWDHMGISSRFHKRKLQLAMAGYRRRFERHMDLDLREGQGQNDEEDDLNSEYAPSELSDIIASEDRAIAAEAAYESQRNNNKVEDDDYSSEDEKLDEVYDESNAVSVEQQQARAMDAQNMRIELIVRGDGENYPVSDIVTHAMMRYNKCALCFLYIFMCIVSMYYMHIVTREREISFE